MNICIYGSASKNLDSVYLEACEKFGELLAKRGHGLVFGGSSRGLMGATARGVKKAGGEVLGIVPRFFDEEGDVYEECDDYIYTETMGERKDLFRINADAFVILPGGIGTFDEFFETIVYKGLGQMSQPVVLYNVNGYYDKLEEFMQISIGQKFVRVHEGQLYEVLDQAEAILDFIEQDA